MLTNCKDCKFYAEYSCAVNPTYLAAFNQLQELDKTQRETIVPLMESCTDWQESEELEVRDANIQLTLRAWKQIAQSSSYTPDIKPLVQKTYFTSLETNCSILQLYTGYKTISSKG